MRRLKKLIPRPLVIATRAPRRALTKGRYKLLFLQRRMAGHHGTVLLEPYGVPQTTIHFFALYKICAELGWSIKDGSRYKGGLRLFWPNNETPEARAYPHLINGRCININKSLVVKNFESVFGYGYSVDPRNPSGPYVRKSEENARHDGQIVEGSGEPQSGFVYQRLINNIVDCDTVEDIRLIFMRGVLPFCFRKTKYLRTRFAMPSLTTSIERTSSLVSGAESSLVLALCDVMGLDYGEIDCLRDRDDGRLYVLDINRTPTGPPWALPKDQKQIATQKMASAFAQAFPMPVTDSRS
jgi:hypothetical protein